jgi:4-amino-4-deoxy-L-arabinose transferase-like glycosyltransferase
MPADAISSNSFKFHLNLDPFKAMATRSDAVPARWRRPFLAWLDGIEKGWGIAVLIVGFAATWMLFLRIAYLDSDLHPDVLETWSLGRSFAWGNAKHPPLMGWVAYVWTLVFPLTDWAFQLLAMTNAAVALWAIDLISRRFVRGDKRAIVLLLLMLLPAYQFHAQRFNANTVLLAIWPLATYCFLQSFETRQIKWAAAAGALAAVAMLGKYYSIFLLGGFAFAAVCHPQRRIYFRSPAPWVSSVVGSIVLVPHLYWLATTGAAPFEYAMQAHGGREFWPSMLEAGTFLVGTAATLAIPALSWVLIAQSRLIGFTADFRAMSSGLRLLFLVCVGTIGFPPIVAVAFGTDMTSLWAMQGLFLIGILIVCGASYPIERFYAVNLAVLVIGIALVALTIAAPVHAFYRNAYGYDEHRNFYRLAALELTRRWHQVSRSPLPAIGGEDGLAFATAFYSPDHPHYRRPIDLQSRLTIPPEHVSEDGWAAMCFSDCEVCGEWVRTVRATAPDAVSFDFVLTNSLWGRPGVTARIVAVIVLPRMASRLNARLGHVRFGSRLCENSEVQMARRNSVSVSLISEINCTASLC